MAGPASAHHPGRSIAIIGVVVVLLVVAAVVAALTLGSRGETTFPAGSPQAAFQAYYRASQAGDLTTAYGSFSQSVHAQMSPEQYAQLASSYGSSMAPPGTTQRLTINEVVTHASASATLYVTVERVSGSGLDVSRFTYDRQIWMVQEDGAWKIGEALLGVDPAPLLKAP
ncbi:MAG TPA: hypothetical protein VMU89_09570 [Thermomicrobiaceae bacterium]|nr:hypothetical protein [Thermomicrobiaceae bacterium]